MLEGEMLLHPFRVLELADEKAVFCGKLLADFGADVVKVELPLGDKTRNWPPFVNNEQHREKSLYFLYHNTNKKGVTLNLEDRDGREILTKLVANADVLLESFDPGYLARLGLDYHALSAVNPRLIMASITPFGQTGPYRHYKASDLVNMAMAGFMQLCGDPNGPPLRLGAEQSFLPASYYAATAIMMALHSRRVSDRGQYIDVSIQEAGVSFLEDRCIHQNWVLQKMNVTRLGNARPGSVPNGMFECKDGWVFVAVVSAAEWDALARWVSEATGNDELLDDMYKGPVFARASYADVVNLLVGQFTKGYTKKQLLEEGRRRDISVLPANTAEDVARCPQLAARRYFVEVDHPSAGQLRYPRQPVMFSDDLESPPIRRPAPLLGEHNHEIYGGELRLTPEELESLRSKRVI